MHASPISQALRSISCHRWESHLALGSSPVVYRADIPRLVLAVCRAPWRNDAGQPPFHKTGSGATMAADAFHRVVHSDRTRLDGSDDGFSPLDVHSIQIRVE